MDYTHTHIERLLYTLEAFLMYSFFEYLWCCVYSILSASWALMGCFTDISLARSKCLVLSPSLENKWSSSVCHACQNGPLLSLAPSALLCVCEFLSWGGCLIGYHRIQAVRNGKPKKWSFVETIDGWLHVNIANNLILLIFSRFSYIQRSRTTYRHGFEF